MGERREIPKMSNQKYVDEIMKLIHDREDQGLDDEDTRQEAKKIIRQAQLDVLMDVAQTVREMTPADKKTPKHLQKLVEEIYEKVRGLKSQLKEGKDE